MKTDWFTKPLRIAALQCNYEQGENLKAPARWRAMGFNCEQLKHIMDVGGRITSDFNLRAHGDLLRAYLKETRKNRLKVILYLNVHVFAPDENERRKDWAQQDAAGGFYKNYGTCYCICVNSPWHGHFFRLLRQLAAFEIDGIFLDGPIIIPGGCFCRHCQKLFRRQTGRGLRQASAAEQWQFNAGSLDRFMRQARRRFKATKPAGVFYNNLDALHPTPSYYLMPASLEYNDIIGTEGGFFGSPPGKAADAFKPAVTARVLEGLAPDKPRVNFMAANNYPWSWYPHAPAESVLCIASTMANACNIWYGLHGSMRMLAAPGAQAAGAIMRQLARHDRYFVKTRSAARVAMLYSFVTERVYHTALAETDLYGKQHDVKNAGGNLRQAVFGFADVLLRSGIPFDIITDIGLTAATLGRYDCVILPAAACLADADLSLLRQYVAAGGNLVAAFDASLYTPDGRQRREFGLGDVFGAAFQGAVTRYQNWNYFSMTVPEHSVFAGLNLPLYPAPGFGLDVAALDGAEVLARFHGALDGRYEPIREPAQPFAVWNRHGRGQCLYLAGTFGEMCYNYNPEEYRVLLRNAVRRLARPVAILEGDAANVEVVVRTQGRRTIVHLVNHDGAPPRPFTSVHPKRNLRLILPDFKRPSAGARALLAGKTCRCRPGPSGLTVPVPEMNEYEIIAVE